MQVSLERQEDFSYITYGGDGNGNNKKQYGEAGRFRKTSNSRHFLDNQWCWLLW